MNLLNKIDKDYERFGFSLDFTFCKETSKMEPIFKKSIQLLAKYCQIPVSPGLKCIFKIFNHLQFSISWSIKYT